MLNFNADTEKCTRCGICVNECSRGALEMSPTGPRKTENAEFLCFHCQHCLTACPTGAISIDGIGAADCPPAFPIPQNGEMLNLIRARRSCRVFKNENLSAETLDMLKEMLAYPPTGCNARSLRFALVEDQRTMDRIRENSTKRLLEEFKKTPMHPVAAKFERMKPMLERNVNPIFRNAPHMVVVAAPQDTPCLAIDPIIALSYFELYAQTLGVGTLWCGLAYWLHDLMPEIMLELGIPEEYKLGYIMLFGPPAWDFKRGALRKLEPENIVSAR